MRVAVVHYHLRSGGVTRVIERHLAAVASGAEFAVLTGEQPSSESVLPYDVVPGLGYDDVPVDSKAASVSSVKPDVLAERLCGSAKKILGGEPDIWHFHNHSLGKNSALPEAIKLIASRGRVLLQIHDFAEDGRPKLFHSLLRNVGEGDMTRLGEKVYPQADNIHYATLNSRDYKLLSVSGVPAERLHLLPNPVVLPDDADDAGSTILNEHEGVFLYVTRAIRRKNIGEFLLWSSMAEQDERFGVTLAPENPVEKCFYDEWVKFAAIQNLPVEFDVGKRTGLSLASLFKCARTTVTTSVAEGFGLSFLEPWLASRPVFGRALPEITSEFVSAGVDLSMLYERLLVPLSSKERDELARKIDLAMTRNRVAYGKSACRENSERAFAASISDGRADFARLDEDLQRVIIKKVVDSRSFKTECSPTNLVPRRMDLNKIILNNKSVIKRVFNKRNFGKRLIKVYENLMASEVDDISDGFDENILLDEFLAPERFFLLRS